MDRGATGWGAEVPVAVYVVVAVCCLAAFQPEGWQIGAYLVAVTTVAYLTQVVAVSLAAPSHAALAQN